MVEQEVGQCYECQVTTKEYRQEPLKMTEIPEKPWQVVSVDFGGPYPDGHYNLVVIDKRTRYPEVESVHSTAAKPTKEKLKKIFATYGTPEQWKLIMGLHLIQKSLRNLLRKRDSDTPDYAITPKS